MYQPRPFKTRITLTEVRFMEPVIQTINCLAVGEHFRLNITGAVTIETTLTMDELQRSSLVGSQSHMVALLESLV